MNNLDIYTLIFSTLIRENDIRNRSFLHKNEINSNITNISEKVKENEKKSLFKL